jgi:hypothetical protein
MAAVITLQQGNAQKLWLLNSAYLTLIPKKDEPLRATDYRPISMIHSFAKLITKILANRLAPLLKDLVASSQSAFVRGRCIHDNYMLVKHLFHDNYVLVINNFVKNLKSTITLYF